MGMTYDELSVFGRLRKVEKCGPYSMFTKLVHEWGSYFSPLQVGRFIDMTANQLSIEPCTDCRQGETILLWAREESTQDDDLNSRLSRGSSTVFFNCRIDTANFEDQESYSPDDNRKWCKLEWGSKGTDHTPLGFDLRPFLYPSQFPWQFKKIDEVAAALPDKSQAGLDKAKME